METEIKELLERMAVGIERLAEDPVIQMETGPVVCPHCNRTNPVVRVEESQATGPLAEFVIQAECQHCHDVFYAVPLQWSCLRTVEEVKEVVEERVATSGYNGNVN